jgi:hypothetical protein
LQLEPEIAADLRHQVFDDYKHSMLFYLASSFLDKGQYVMLYEFGSDASQYGKCGQEFWSVYITICWFCKRRRLMMDAKLIVGQLPKVLGAEEKAHMYQHARWARFADGADEVHQMRIAQRTISSWKDTGSVQRGTGNLPI